MIFKNRLIKLDACPGAVEWVGDRDLKTAWAECDRADWMLWYAARDKRVKRTTLVRAVCACARTALKYVPAGEDRPRLAIEAAERWAKRPTEKNKQAADAAYAAYAYAAAAATYAANAAAANAAYAYAAAAAAALRIMADIVRRFIKF